MRRVLPALLAVICLVAFLRYLDADFVGTDSLAAVRGARVTSITDFVQLWLTPLNTGNSFAETQAVFYRPIATLVFSMDLAAWGLDAVGYHVTNAVIHAAVVWLAFGLLRAFSLSRLAACVGAALVAFHPSMAAAVPVLARRYDSLSVAFVFASLICLVRALDSTGRSARWLLVASGAALVAALLCKESAFGFVPLLPLAVWARGATLKQQRVLVPHFAAAVVVFGARYAVLGSLGGHVGVGFLEGIDTGGYELMLSRYAQFLVWPLDTWLPGSARHAAIALGLLALLLAATLAALSGLPRRLFGFGLTWVVWFGVFFAALLHMSGPWYMYYPLGGVALMLGVLIDAARNRANWQLRLVPVGLLLAGAIVAGVAALPATPLLRDYRQWHSAGVVTRQILAAARPCIQQLAPGDALTFWNLPRDYLDGSRETEFLAVTLLEPFTMEALVDLVRPGESHEVFVGSSVRLTTPIDALDMRCERPGPGRVRLVAYADGLPVPDLPR